MQNYLMENCSDGSGFMSLLDSISVFHSYIVKGYSSQLNSFCSVVANDFLTVSNLHVPGSRISVK